MVITKFIGIFFLVFMQIFSHDLIAQTKGTCCDGYDDSTKLKAEVKEFLSMMETRWKSHYKEKKEFSSLQSFTDALLEREAIQKLNKSVVPLDPICEEHGEASTNHRILSDKDIKYLKEILRTDRSLSLVDYMVTEEKTKDYGIVLDHLKKLVEDNPK